MLKIINSLESYPMAGATTLALVDSILKEIYEPPLRDQLQSEVLTLTRIEKTSEGVSHEVGGKYVTFPTRIRRNHGIGARRENEPLPEAKSQKYVSARVGLKYLYGALSITGPTMELAKTNPQAFSSAMELETEGLRETLRKDLNRQMYGTESGIMATIPTGTASAGTTHRVTNAQYLEDGMIVDVRSSDGSTVVVSKAMITEVQDDNDVVFDTSFDSTDGDIITRAGSYGKEKVGFQQIVSTTGTLFNIDPTLYPTWKSVVNSNGAVNRALSEGLMIKTVDDVYKKGGKTTVGFTTLGVRRSYFNLLSQQRQFVNTKKFEGGFEGLAFTTDRGEIPIIADVDCQPNRIYFMNEKELKLYEANQWGFMNYDGSNWQRVKTAEGNFDAYEAMMYKYCELGTHRRNSHALLSDITEAEA